MKKYLFLSTILLFACSVPAQSVSKGFKALEAGDYAEAKSQFKGVILLEPNDAVANFGLSRYYGISATEEKDNERALEYLVAAEKNYPEDEKGQKKLAKYGMEKVDMVARREQIERSFLEDAKEANTVAALDAFIERFPESSSMTTAINYRNKLAYDQAVEAGTVAGLDRFISTYPDAYELKTAVPMRDKMAAEVALKENTEEGFLHFIRSYPDAKQAPQIQQRLNAVAFENAKTANTAQAFREYIANYPESIFLAQAKQKLEWLESKEGN